MACLLTCTNHITSAKTVRRPDYNDSCCHRLMDLEGLVSWEPDDKSGYEILNAALSREFTAEPSENAEKTI